MLRNENGHRTVAWILSDWRWMCPIRCTDVRLMSKWTNSSEIHLFLLHKDPITFGFICHTLDAPHCIWIRYSGRNLHIFILCLLTRPGKRQLLNFVVVRWRFIGSSQTYCYGMPFASRNGTVHLFHISSDLLFSSFCHYHSICHWRGKHAPSTSASECEVIWWKTKWSNHLLLINGRWTIWTMVMGVPNDLGPFH